ncbi:MAG: hypothetical protein AAF823_09670 [Planctomycetota bacterium]
MAEAIRTDFRGPLVLVHELAKDFKHDLHLRLIVADQFEDRVNSVHSEYGILRSAPYKQEREFITGIGITLVDTRSDAYQASVILDGRLWDDNSAYNLVSRTYILCHEIGHVCQYGNGYGRLTDDETTIDGSFESELSFQARILWDEYDADILATKMVRHCLRTGEGDCVNISNFLSGGYVDAVKDILAEMIEFASCDVQTYRVYAIGLDDLLPKAKRMVGTLTLILGHLLGINIDGSDRDRICRLLRDLEGFDTYILPSWERLINGLSYSTIAESKSTLVAVQREILWRLGLDAQDLEDGNIFVHVHKPLIISSGRA